MRWSYAVLVSVPLLGCDPGCEAADALEAGTMAGTLDDADWSGPGAAWFASETGVQVSTSPGTDDWRVTFVAQQTVDGRDVTRKAKVGGLPVDVTLLTGAEGGWATVNQVGDDDTYATAEADGGTLRLSRKKSGELYGCAVFTASDGRRDLTASVAFRALDADLESTR